MPDPDTIPTSGELEVEHHRTENAQFPCSLDIGDPVWVTLQGYRLAGWVRAVTFTRGKVRFAVMVWVDVPEEGDEVTEPDHTTLHNIDSALVSSRSGERLEWGIDNYS